MAKHLKALKLKWVYKGGFFGQLSDGPEACSSEKRIRDTKLIGFQLLCGIVVTPIILIGVINASSLV